MRTPKRKKRMRKCPTSTSTRPKTFLKKRVKASSLMRVMIKPTLRNNSTRLQQLLERSLSLSLLPLSVRRAPLASFRASRDRNADATTMLREVAVAATEAVEASEATSEVESIEEDIRSRSEAVRNGKIALALMVEATNSRVANSNLKVKKALLTIKTPTTRTM